MSVIIPRSEHPISRKNIDPDALKVMYRLGRKGFTAYLVDGGRDEAFGEGNRHLRCTRIVSPSSSTRAISTSAKLASGNARAISTAWYTLAPGNSRQMRDSSTAPVTNTSIYPAGASFCVRPVASN